LRCICFILIWNDKHNFCFFWGGKCPVTKNSGFFVIVCEKKRGKRYFFRLSIAYNESLQFTNKIVVSLQRSSCFYCGCGCGRCCCCCYYYCWCCWMNNYVLLLSNFACFNYFVWLPVSLYVKQNLSHHEWKDEWIGI